MKDCTNPTADKVKEDMFNHKRPSSENEMKNDRPVLARTAATEAGRGREAGRGGGRIGGRGRGAGRGVNPNNLVRTVTLRTTRNNTVGVKILISALVPILRYFAKKACSTTKSGRLNIWHVGGDIKFWRKREINEKQKNTQKETWMTLLRNETINTCLRL